MSATRIRPVLLLSGVSVAAYYSLKLFSDRKVVPSLSPLHFTPTTLIESIHVSSDTKLLTLSVPPKLLPSNTNAFAPIFSIFIKDSDIQVERPYTPLEGIDKNGCIKLWIKKYEHGEVGRWLHSRHIGDSIEIRGPVPTWSALWQNGHWDEIVMISGGTGITPFYQLLHNVFNVHDTSNTCFTLLHGSRSLAHLPPSSMMRSLTTMSQEYPDRFRLHFFVDSMSDSSEHPSLNIQRGRIGKSVVQAALRPTHDIPWWRRFLGQSSHTLPASHRKVLVLVCGPEGMVSAIAGPYGRNYSQGEVGGILGELGLQSHQVWKL